MDHDEPLLIKIPQSRDGSKGRHSRKTRRIAIAALIVSVVAALTSVGSFFATRREAAAVEESLRLLGEERRPALSFLGYAAQRDASGIIFRLTLKNVGGSSARRIDYRMAVMVDGQVIATVVPQDSASLRASGLVRDGEWTSEIRAQPQSWTAIDNGASLLKVSLEISYEDPVFGDRREDSWCHQYVPTSDNSIECHERPSREFKEGQIRGQS